jgi:hypothetical protein
MIDLFLLLEPTARCPFPRPYTTLSNLAEHAYGTLGTACTRTRSRLVAGLKREPMLPQAGVPEEVTRLAERSVPSRRSHWEGASSTCVAPIDQEHFSGLRPVCLWGTLATHHEISPATPICRWHAACERFLRRSRLCDATSESANGRSGRPRRVPKGAQPAPIRNRRTPRSIRAQRGRGGAAPRWAKGCGG